MTIAAPARVLLVDDHPLVRTAVRQAIDADDIDVVGEAGTAEEALEMTERLRPDLVLLDLDLPDRSGLAYLRDVRPGQPDLQVVVLTVSDADRDLIEAIDLGAVGYLTKDVSPTALLESVRAARAGGLPLPRRLGTSLISRLAGDGSRAEAEAADDATAGAAIERLTPRERQVLELIADGRTDRQASEALGISVRTVEAHVSSILRALPASNRAEAARRYRASISQA